MASQDSAQENCCHNKQETRKANPRRVSEGEFMSENSQQPNGHKQQNLRPSHNGSKQE